MFKLKIHFSHENDCEVNFLERHGHNPEFAGIKSVQKQTNVKFTFLKDTHIFPFEIPKFTAKAV
jgi:hypothetical protein